MAYHGGPQKYFQRAESASFFGREIGTHVYPCPPALCEALARYGDAESFFHALCQANPIGIRAGAVGHPAPGELLLLQLRRGVCRSLRGAMLITTR